MKDLGGDNHIEEVYFDCDPNVLIKIISEIIDIINSKTLTHGQKKLKILSVMATPVVSIVSETFVFIAKQEGFDLDSAHSILCSFMTALFMNINMPIINRLFSVNEKPLSEDEFLRITRQGIDVLYDSMKNKGEIIAREFYKRELH